MQDLKEKTIRGGFVRILAQGANFAIRIGSLMVLARLLDPRDFGLLSMVTAFTGVLTLFRDFGLSTVTVQAETTNEKQTSTLFWLNVLFGIVLTLITACFSPVFAKFYHEPRLMAVSLAVASSFFFNAIGIQHGALLQREMRFTALAVINVTSLVVSNGIAILMAMNGFGYWSLVVMTIGAPLVTSIGSWIASGWIPGPPSRGVGMRWIAKFGGIVTLNGVIVYIAYNLEKVLLGWFWGAEVIGLYGRAYQLVNIPIDNSNYAIGEVALAALSRIQNDAQQMRNYFLKGYSLVIGFTVPITFICALFGDDMIAVLLGPKWKAAAPIFRLLAPTILMFAMMNPFAWLLYATGKVVRSLQIAFAIAPLVITGYLIGLPYGPKGVALGYSIAMTLWLLPHIVWCVRGSAITFMDVMRTVSRPILSSVIAAGLSQLLLFTVPEPFPPLPRLSINVAFFTLIYAGILLFAMGQKSLYMNLLQGVFPRLARNKQHLQDAS